LLCCFCQEKQTKSSEDGEDGEDAAVVVDPPLWKCYWTKMQLMLLLSGLFMLLGSLLHLACPLLLILIIDYVENKRSVGSTARNVTLPLVRLLAYLIVVFITVRDVKD